MKYKYEIENIFPKDISFEQTKDIICKKIARLIIIWENACYDNKWI